MSFIIPYTNATQNIKQYINQNINTQQSISGQNYNSEFLYSFIYEIEMYINDYTIDCNDEYLNSRITNLFNKYSNNLSQSDLQQIYNRFSNYENIANFIKTYLFL